MVRPERPLPGIEALAPPGRALPPAGRALWTCLAQNGRGRCGTVKCFGRPVVRPPEGRRGPVLLGGVGLKPDLRGGRGTGCHPRAGGDPGRGVKTASPLSRG